jgi:hypothetical protein
LDLGNLREFLLYRLKLRPINPKSDIDLTR